MADDFRTAREPNTTQKTGRLFLLGAGALVILSALVLTRLNNNYKASEASSISVLAGDWDDCILSHFQLAQESGIGEVGIGALANVSDASIGALGQYLTEASQDTSSPIETAMSPIYLFKVNRLASGAYRVESAFHCLVIAHGSRGEIDDSVTKLPDNLQDRGRLLRIDPESIFSRSDPQNRPFSALRRLHFNDIPLSYFEFQVDQDHTGTVLRFIPKVIYFRNSISRIEEGAKKNVEITVTVGRPNSVSPFVENNNRNSIVFQAPIVISDIMIGSVAGAFDEGSNSIGFQSGWFELSNLPDKQYQEKVEDEADANHTSGVQFWPANVLVTYRERSAPDMLLTYIGAALKNGASSAK